MIKTDNVQCGADIFIHVGRGGVNGSNKGKVGAPYQYVMLAASLRVGIGVQYRQLEGIVGDIIGESNTVDRLASG